MRRLPLFLGLLLTTWMFAFGAAHAAVKHALDTAHFHILYDAAKMSEASNLETVAEAAYARIGGLFGFTLSPGQRITVILYADRAEFQKDTQLDRREMVVGVASSADETIRLDASGLFETPEHVVGHELTHIVLFKMLGRNVESLPLWFNEGLAQEAGGADGVKAHDHVVDAMFHGGLLPLGSLRQNFPSGDANGSAGLAYDEGQDAVERLLNQGDWLNMRAFLGRLQVGDSYDVAMRAIYHMSGDEWDSKYAGMLRLGAVSDFWLRVAEVVVPLMMFIALAWGVATVRRHRRRQVEEEAEPVSDLEPPSWWREDQWR